MERRVLKKCPCCGGNARYMEDMRFHEKKQDYPKWYIKCMQCGIETDTATIPIITGIWNKRINDNEPIVRS